MNTLGLILLSIGGIGDWGLILIAIILLFGGKKIPELMRGMGQGISEFNRAKNNINSEIQEGVRQGGMNQNQQQPYQNQNQSNSNNSSITPPANSAQNDQLQKQIEQLQQQLDQLKQQQH